MSARLRVVVYSKGEAVVDLETDGQLQLVRQRNADEPLYSARAENDIRRVCVAAVADYSVATIHIWPDYRNRLKAWISNTNDRINLSVAGSDLRPGHIRETPLPALVTLGPSTAVRVEAVGVEADAADSGLRGGVQLSSLPSKTRPPADNPRDVMEALPTGARITDRDLIVWMNGAIDVLQAAAGSDDFFKRAAQATVETVKLDYAQVLLRENDTWAVKVAAMARDDTVCSRPSIRVLARVLEEKKTFYESPDAGDLTASLTGVEVAVAAPLLNRHDAVIGALYGIRQRRQGRDLVPRISELEAMIVELLARGVAAGLARLEKEREVVLIEARAELKARYAPCFASPVLDEALQNKDFLRGRETEVTVLFCDMRGFTRITQALGVQVTERLCQSAFDALSECVLAEEGVLVDFTGDGLMAMWGAPSDKQTDHAARACRAALQMTASLVDLNRDWRDNLHTAVTLGIGIHTGLAKVGNIGSKRRFKYGPRGPMVNLASRIEGITKQYPCTILITSETKVHFAPGEFHTRRLGLVRPVGVNDPVEVHELVPDAHPGWPQAREEYEAALSHFVARRFIEAARVLGIWSATCPEDGPALCLLERAVTCHKGPVPENHPVWELKGK